MNNTTKDSNESVSFEIIKYLIQIIEDIKDKHLKEQLEHVRLLDKYYQLAHDKAVLEDTLSKLQKDYDEICKSFV